MKILVTGGAGFIGSHLSASLASSGHSVTVVDNYSDYYSVDLKKRRANTFLQPFGIHPIEIDLSESHSLHEKLDEYEFETVIHLAAQAGVRIPRAEYQKYIDANLVAFCNVAQYATSHNVSNFLYASSSSVYGDSSRESFSEQSYPLTPRSFYGATKLSNEILAHGFAQESKTSFRGLRFFTAYGPWGRPDMAYFRLISKALIKTPFTLFGDGSMLRDFTYIDDVINAITLLHSELNLRPNGFADVVNIGGGHPRSMLELMQLVAEDKESLFDVREQSNTADVLRTQADPTYLKRLTGYVPSTSLETGIARTKAWAKSLEDEGVLSRWMDSVR